MTAAILEAPTTKRADLEALGRTLGIEAARGRLRLLGDAWTVGDGSWKVRAVEGGAAYAERFIERGLTTHEATAFAAAMLDVIDDLV